jgi:hypothetical protein
LVVLLGGKSPRETLTPDFRPKRRHRPNLCPTHPLRLLLADPISHGALIFLQPSVGHLNDISMMAWNDNLKGVEPKRRFR